jgi:glycolate oxidase
VAGGHVPSLLEIMDATCLRAVEQWRRMDLPADAGAMLLAQSDSGAAAAAEIAAMATLFAQASATEVVEAEDPAEGELLLEARRVVLLALERLGTTLIDDVCVPLTRLADLFDGVEKVAASYGVLISVVGHAGDGNMHPTVVFDAADGEQAGRARQAFGAVMDLGLELGGTITGEHGVGMLKKEWLEKELGPVGMRLHRDIKRVLDPHGILNPGKVLN